MPLVHITNISHGPRGFHETGNPVPRVLEIGDSFEGDVDKGTHDIFKRAHEAKEVVLVNLGERLQAVGRFADPGEAGRAMAEATGTSAEQAHSPGQETARERQIREDAESLARDEEAARLAAGGGSEADGKDGPVDVSLLDDDQLRMLIEQGTGKPPHPQLGRKKLEEQAAPFLTPKEA